MHLYINKENILPFKITLLFCSILFFNSQLMAAPVIGKIIKLKGKVTALYPGELEAVQLKKGAKVKEDTSLLSAKGAFAIVRLNDKSKLILGPNSKLVVQFPKNAGTGIVTLLKGKVRSKVPKNKKNAIKQIIQTRSAALGVRGTEFQATFNPTSAMTSLVTYKGKVALVKKNKKSRKKLDLLTSRKKKNKGKVKNRDLDKLFKKQAVVVEPGSYSAVSENLKKATEPVNLNPKQFSILKANDTFVKKKISEKKLKKEEERIKKIYAKRAKRREKKAGATFDLKSGSYKPKDGGYIDLETGIYVPPSSKAKFDKKLNIFVDKDVEEKLSASGDFKTPDGLKLDPKKGFVAVNDSEEAKKKVQELNKEIAGQIVKPRKPTFDELESVDDDEAYDKFFKVK
jgi:hypothetical protein